MPAEHPGTQAAPDHDERLAAKLRGFGPVGIAAAVVVVLLGPVLEPFNVIAPLVWARASRTPWRELGLARPRNWALTIVSGVLFGAALKIVSKALVMPLLGAPDINPRYHYLAHNSAALPGMLFDVIVGAGFGEELVFRGFLFERLGKLFGPGTWAKVGIVALTSVYFGALHYFGQGLAGAEQAVLTGLAFGTVYAATGRLWPVIFAHAAFDVTAVLIIYWDLEPQVAHLIFK